jgi:hypothetical protein
MGTAIANASGAYAITLADGSYKLFISPNAAGFANFWYGGTSIATATAVALHATTNLDLTAVATFSLSGTVRTIPGVALPGAFVAVYDSTTLVYMGTAIANASGSYSISLLDGSYNLFISPNSPGHANFWLGGNKPANATVVAVHANTTLNIAAK